jgi:acyl transferase domain-containing protein
MSLLAAHRIPSKRLNGGIPFHSSYMKAAASQLQAAMANLEPTRPQKYLISTVTGEQAPRVDSAYWATQMRTCVRLHRATKAALARGCNMFLEVGPDSALSTSLREIFEEQTPPFEAVATIATPRRQFFNRAGLLETLARLYQCGLPVDWGLHIEKRARLISLPSYPWEHKRYWHSPPGQKRPRISPLLHAKIASASEAGTTYFECEIDLADPTLNYLAGHRYLGEIWLPASALLEMVLEAAGTVWTDSGFELQHIIFERPVVLEAERPSRLQMVLAETDGRSRDFQLHVFDVAAQRYRRCVTGTVRPLKSGSFCPQLDISAVLARCTYKVDISALSQAFDSLGFSFSEDFMGFGSILAGDSEVFARLQPTSHVQKQLAEYVLHPALVDTALRAGLATRTRHARPGAALPTRLGKLCVYAMGANIASVNAKMRRRGNDLLTDVYLLDAQGHLIAEVRDLTIRDSRSNIPGALEKGLYGLSWQSAPVGAVRPPDDLYLIFSDQGGAGARIANALQSAGAKVLAVHKGDEWESAPGLGLPKAAGGSCHIRRVIQDCVPASSTLRIIYCFALDLYRR